jgi:fibronectin-binding autotransporter adhesin
MCLLALAVPQAMAQAPDYEWQVGGGDWENPANWVGAAVPDENVNDGHIRFSGAGGDVVGDAGDVGSTTGIGLLDFDGATGSYNLNSTGSLTFSAGGQIVNNSLSAQTISMDLHSGGGPGFVVDAAAATLNLTGTITLNDGGLEVAGANATNISGSILGAGGLTKTGGGTLTLSGMNFYAGGTAINGGTLSISDSLNLGDPAGGLSFNGGTLHVSDDVALTHDVELDAGGGTFDADPGVSVLVFGKISGSGQLVKVGDGTLILFNLPGDPNDYTGGTLVEAGALIGDAASLQGDIENNAVVIFDQTGAATYLGTMSGTGTLIKSGAGALTLAGANSYSGGTVIDDGTLIIEDPGNLGDPAGGLTFNGGTLQFADTMTLGHNVQLEAGGGTFNTDGNLVTLSGDIAGDGGLTKTGDGRLTLNGASTYTGATVINAGTLRAGPAGLLSADSAFSIAAGATLELNDTNQTIASLSGAAGSEVDLGSGELTVGDAADTTFAGVISGVGGRLVKQGAGALTLTGANTYTGGTTVNDGRLIGNATSLQGDIENNAEVVFDQAGNATYAGAMDGTGTLRKQGAATLTLTGANSYSGGTVIEAGSIRGDAASVQGDIEVGPFARLTFDQDGLDGTYSGQLSGSGAVSKLGDAVLTIDGAGTTFEGVVEIDDGVLRFDGAGTLGDPARVDVGFGATLDLNGTAQTFRVLACFEDGNVLVDGGTMNVGAFDEVFGVLSIDLGAGGQVNVGADGSSSTLAGVISGAGALTKLGDGTLVLTGVNTFAGQTNVAAGTLVVNGSLASAVQVAAGATLAGTGTVGNLTVSGTIAPGNSIGTMNVAGNYTHNAGATYEVEINDAGQSDRIHATGAATIQGGHVEVTAESGSYSDGATYTIIQADGGRVGTFDSISHNLPFFNITLQYFPNSVGLLLESTVTSFASVAATPNQRAVGTQLDLIQNGPTGDFLTVIEALQALNAEDVRTAMDHIGGEPYANLSAINLAMADAFADRVLYRLGSLSCNPNRCVGGEELWAYALGGWERQGRRQPYFGYSSSSAGFLIGMDHAYDDLTIGLASGYAHKNTTFDLSAGNAANFFNVTSYAAMDHEGHHLHGGVGYTYGWNAVDRTIAITGLPTRVARGAPQAGMLALFGKYGRDYQAGRLTLTPTLGFRFMRASIIGTTESGAQSLDLTLSSHHRTSASSQMGGKIAFCPAPRWRAEGYAEWDHQYGHRAFTVPVALDGGVYQFFIAGVPLPRDSARVGATVIGDLRDQLSLYLNYDAVLRTSYGSHNVAGGLTIRY